MRGRPPFTNAMAFLRTKNVSDTGNDFSSIIRGLINIVYVTAHSEREKRMAPDRYKWHLVQRKVKFALYNHISIATLNIPPLKKKNLNKSFKSVGTARSPKHHCTADMEVCDMTRNKYWER